MRKKILMYNATKNYSNNDGIVGMAMLQVLALIMDRVEECDDPAMADILIGCVIDEECSGMQSITKYYSEDQTFLILSLQKNPPNDLPENVKWIYFENAAVDFIQFLSDFMPKEGKIKRCIELQPENLEGSWRVLVVDDKNENLEGAVDLLGKNHFLTLAGGYDEGLRMIEKNDYDVVLSDCQMPVGVQGSALVGDAYELGDTVHNGFFLLFPATLKGARFAIVTDANHHRDWVSAILDSFESGHVVNGQPVVFFNNIKKRWDKALEIIMNK